MILIWIGNDIGVDGDEDNNKDKNKNCKTAIINL